MIEYGAIAGIRHPLLPLDSEQAKDVVDQTEVTVIHPLPHCCDRSCHRNVRQEIDDTVNAASLQVFRIQEHRQQKGKNNRHRDGKDYPTGT